MQKVRYTVKNQNLEGDNAGKDKMLRRNVYQQMNHVRKHGMHSENTILAVDDEEEKENVLSKPEAGR